MKQKEIASKYDVVIVGSGPAGAAAAQALAGHGLKTVIIEKARLPRYKMCSGVLAPSSVKFVSDHFGQIPEMVLAAPKETKGARIYTSIGGKIEDLPFSLVDQGPGLEKSGLSVKRAEFDHWLCIGSGAELIDRCRFKKIENQGPEITILLERNGQEQATSTRFLVGADGPLSRVRSSISPDFDKGLRMIPNYEEWYIGEIDLAPKWLNVFLDKKLTGYFATVFHKDGKIIVVTGAKQPESVKAYFHVLIDYLKQHHGLVINEKFDSYACVLHDMAATGNFHLGAGNVLLAGEAGGFSRAMGEGISSAFVTGKAAGKAILNSLESGQVAIKIYADKVAPEAEFCIALNRMIGENFGLNPFTR